LKKAVLKVLAIDVNFGPCYNTTKENEKDEDEKNE